MKKTLMGIAAVIALLLAVVGPDVLALVRLMDFIETSSEAYQADGGPWPHVTDTCTGCHGAKGDSLHQGYPDLAGQPALYIATQLRNFATEQRPNPNMSPLAMTLSESEIKTISDYFARQPVVENGSFEPDPVLRDKGKQLVTDGGCAACHGEQLMGRDLNPRLSAQGYDYLVAQLDAFAVGKRSEPTGTMQRLASAVSKDDRRAIASYLASLRPQASKGQQE